MKVFELVKRKDHWALYNEDGHKIAANIDGYNSKLSIKNCEAIANGYDLDDIVENHPLEISNYSHSCGIEQGIIYGFQKALELVEYRLSKETEFDVEIVTELAYTVNENSETEMMPEPHIKLDLNGCLILKRI